MGLAAAAQQPAPIAPLEADNDHNNRNDGNDTDSFYTSDGGSSLASSIYKYRLQNGRTYHAYKYDEGVNYICPNDESESDRLDIQHNLVVMMQGNKLHMAPVGQHGHKLRRVLDVGCGTGIWTLDFAEEHPEASIVGIDLSPIQPSFVPPNVEFFVDNLEEEWTFDTPFDFIYMRFMTGSIKDWPKWLGQVYKNLQPGGFIELSDPINPVVCDDETLPENSPLVKWNRLLLEASQKLGAPINSALKYEEQLKQAGFVNIVKHEFKWPMNSWPKDRHYKDLSHWVYESVGGGIEGLSLMLFTSVLGWPLEEVRVLLALAKKEMANRSYHGYWNYYTVYAQKPE